MFPGDGLFGREPGTIAAMLDWYRAAPIIVPRPGARVMRPVWVDAPFPRLAMPTLVIWGVEDQALLPHQLDGPDRLVTDLVVARVDAGHFVPWEAPAAVNAAIRPFLAARPIRA